MAQYQSGTVTATNGSAVVTGLSTAWLANINVSDIFTIIGSGVWYEVGSIDTDLQITLNANYAGPTLSGQYYTITRDFTPILGLPYPVTGDLETASIIKRAFLDIDSGITTSSFTHKGDWLAATTYVVDDAAHSGGRYFRSKVGANLNNTPPSTGTGDAWWGLISDRAAPGTPGTGDMLALDYDPTAVAGDAFDMDNMVAGVTNKILTAAESTKLAGVETGSTADQTGAEIKTAYELEANTNAYTDAEVTKLAAVEALADVTDAANVATAGAVMEADSTTALMGFVIDEDTMVSDLATKVPTQQSTKAYVDTQVATAVIYQGTYNAATNVPDLDTAPAGVVVGDMYAVSAAGTFFGTAVAIGDVLISKATGATTEAEWMLISGLLTGVEIKALYEAEADTNPYTDGAVIKLAGIATGANLYVHPVTHSADLIVDGTTNKVYSATEQTKLAGIEIGATIDQTDLEIETAYNNQVTAVNQATAETGTSTTIQRWTAQRVRQSTLSLASTVLPIQDVTAGSIGTSTNYARQDHAHPSDTSRAPTTHIALDVSAVPYVNTPAGTALDVYLTAVQFDNATFDLEVITVPAGIANDLTFLVPNATPQVFIVDNHNPGSNVYKIYFKVDNVLPGNDPVLIPSVERVLLYSNGSHIEGLTVASLGHLNVDAAAGAYVGAPPGTAVEVAWTAGQFNNTSFDIEITSDPGVGFANNVTIAIPDDHSRIFVVDNKNLTGNAFDLWVRDNNVGDPTGVLVPKATKFLMYSDGTHCEPISAVYVGGPGSGDMFIATYDPTAVSGDAFLMTNFAEGATNKILTATERTKLAGIATGAQVNRALTSQAEAEAGTDNVKGMTSLRSAQAIAALGGGGLTWIVKTVAYTAIAGDGVFADTTTTGAFTVTLPITPSLNNKVAFCDYDGNLAVANLTIARNGETIMGLAEDMIISTANAAFELIYNGADWRLK